VTYISNQQGGAHEGWREKMTQFLPPNLLALFAPREPIPYLAPLDKLAHEKKPWPYTGVSDFLKEFEVGILNLLFDVFYCFGSYRIQQTHQHLGKLKHVKSARRGRCVWCMWRI